MSDDDWYCRKTWTRKNREEFFRRLQRSRTAYNKAQYAVIQAEQLAATGKREAYVAALELLNMALAKWPEDVQVVRAQDAIAGCFVGLGDLPRAVDAYRQVFKTQRLDPFWLTAAPLDFGWLVATTPMPELYDEALAVLDEFPADTLPVQRYRTSVIRALILAARGQETQARSHARTKRNNQKGRPMALFSRKPKLQDEALSEVAQMFFALPDDPTPGMELLNASRLDFSVESLALVDEYLDTMRKRKLEDDALVKLVLRCGAYVGEVIRRNSQAKTYHWLDNEEAVKLNRSIADFGDGVGGAAILWDGATGFTFPLAKVLKFWENGREDSVRFFAHAMLEQSK
jgi:tetratricopeptide (TPR) repeat protein